MVNHTVPNYCDLFDDSLSYQQAIASIGSDTAIAVCIALLNELHSTEEKFERQKRIYVELSKTFPHGATEHLNGAFADYKTTKNPDFNWLLFGKRYLLEMILEELNNFRTINNQEEMGVEFDFFRAYLLTVQRVNQNDKSKIKFIKGNGDFNTSKYELIWKPILPQFEFNEQPHVIFETYKLLCFLKFAKSQYPAELKEYVTKNGFKSLSQLLSSFNQVNVVTQNEDTTAMLKKLTYLVPNADVNLKHLNAQTINKINGDQPFTMRTIRGFPLYLKADRGYMVIEPDLYYRKNYFGPFFELYHQTQLKQKLAFNQYCINISGALESNLLEPLLTIVAKQDADVLHFDDQSKDVPDGYVRIDKMVFLFEYKSYIFKEQLTQYPEVAQIKEYIDEKFVRTPKGQKKGITQLRDQINIITNGGFVFDRVSFFSEGKESVRIYPIILHHDFMFEMPGVTEYLNEQFADMLDTKPPRFQVMPVTLMNLSVLLDMALGKNDMFFMEKMLIDYLNYLEESRRNFAQRQSPTNLMQAHMSFDELFRKLFVKHTATPDGTQKETLEQLVKLSGISFEDFKEDL